MSLGTLGGCAVALPHDLSVDLGARNPEDRALADRAEDYSWPKASVTGAFGEYWWGCTRRDRVERLHCAVKDTAANHHSVFVRMVLVDYLHPESDLAFFENKEGPTAPE